MSLLPITIEQTNQILEALPEDQQLHLFARHYCQNLSQVLWQRFSVREWCVFLQERYQNFLVATKQEGLILVGKGEGRATGRIVVEVLKPDMQYQLLTLLELLRDLELRIKLTIHPVLPLRYEEEAWQVLADDRQCEKLFDMIYLEIEDTANEERLSQLCQRLPAHIDALHSVREDLAKLQQIRPRLTQLLQNSTQSAAEGREAWIQLLEWLHEDNFSLFGFAAYHHTSQGVQREEDSSLGLLHDHQAWKADSLRETLQALLWQEREASESFIMESLRFTSPLQRFENLMLLRLKFPEAEGWREEILVGLLRKTSLQARNLETPLIREKMQAIFEARQMRPYSYNYNEAIRILSGMPKFALFRAPTAELLQIIDTLLFIDDPSRIHCFQVGQQYVRKGASPALHLLVVLPNLLYTPANVLEVVAFLQSEVPHQSSEYVQAYGEEKSRVHVYFELSQGNWTPNLATLENELIRRLKPWEEQLRDALSVSAPGPQGLEIFERYLPRLPKQYKVRVTPEMGAQDLLEIERLNPDSGVHFTLKEFQLANALEEPVSLLTLYSRNRTHLIKVMPVLLNAGLYVVDQLTTRVGTPQGENLGFIQTFRVTHQDSRQIEENVYQQKLCELLGAVFAQRSENDPLNALVLAANLDWREINVLQAYRNLYLQLGGNVSRNVVNQALLKYPAISRNFCEIFRMLFAPDSRYGDPSHRREVLLPQVRRHYLDTLHPVQEINHDLAFRHLLSLLEATLRTNFFQNIGRHNTLLALKIDSGQVEQMPIPTPYREIYVHDVNLEGTHLRFGPVARGGLRWSDRPEDFRTEVLGLVKTQQTKNVVIVPVGSKGGFVIKQLPSSREEAQVVAKEQYQRFIHGLLSVIDNRDADGQVRPPKQTICYDDPDPYLVVAADKGTATFSDLANSISEKTGFWLGDAFASGGSHGYDHKVVGITARGAWECVRLHFLERDHDIQQELTTVIGIGDMSGDVFGNGMLLSKALQLKAAFNHQHIFLDPNPDPGTSWQERKRLFELPRSTWRDYASDQISEGGGVFDRRAKEVQLSLPVREMLRVEREVMTGEELVQAILRMPADLCWFGGIGTYVKASPQNHLQVGDQANDLVRINAEELQVRVIGEGANLGLTQSARISFHQQGGALNTDAIDNSAGVNMSDYEVNLKILLQLLLRERAVANVEERNQLLENATEEVAELVLANNRGQHRLISMDQLRSRHDFRAYRQLIHLLIEQGMNARSEYIPDIRQLDQLEQSGEGLPRPVLAVLQAYVKMYLYDELLVSSLIPEFTGDETSALYDELYLGYLPGSFRDRFPAEVLQRHPLRREIIATVLTNRLINHAGCAFFFNLQSSSGCDLTALVEGYLALEASLELPTLRTQLLEAPVSEAVRYEAFLAVEQTLGSLLENLVQTNSAPTLSKVQTLGELFKELCSLRGDHPESLEKWEKAGFTPELAQALGGLEQLRSAPAVLQLLQETEMLIAQAQECVRGLNSLLQLDWLEQALEQLSLTNQWEQLQQGLLLQSIQAQQLRLLRLLHYSVHSSNIPFSREALPEKNVEEPVRESLEQINRKAFGAYLEVIEQFQQVGTPDLIMLTVAVQRLQAIS